MDRSIDSIGSCSLDADSTDFSDTSESLNFISPSATREDFTAGITERVRKIQTTQPLTPKLILNQPLNQRTATTTAFFDINSGKISTIVSRANTETNGCYFNGNTEKFLSTKTIDLQLQSPTIVAHANKKPSYLNLACCVNGYSNYTNYDSVERKEINKSREVSPIRPILAMARQQRSSDNLLSVPAPVTFIKQSPMTSITKRFASLNIGDKDTTDNAGIINGNNGSVSNRKSFIQQRVEKLYGTTKILTSTTTTTTIKNSETKHIMNGNGHYHVNGSSSSSTTTTASSSGRGEKENEINEKENDEELYNSLPVMKHLRPEFCKQLQFMSSPRKNNTNANVTEDIKTTTKSISNNSSKVKDNLLEKESLESNIVMERINNINKVSMPSAENVEVIEKSENIENNNNNNNKNCIKNNLMEMETHKSQDREIRDGYYFLRLLYNEKSRILKLADETEKELEELQSDPSKAPKEEIIGLILAAIGKSRLLATKKFKQFEGLCEENLKPKTDGPQTLCEDLQGFWDMMMLQVENIDASFKEITVCRENGWTKPQPPSLQAPKGSRLTKRPLSQAQNGKAATAPIKKSSTASSNNSEAAQKRDEQRKKILEMKRKQKAAMLQQQQENGSSENNDGEKLNGSDTKENGIDMIIL